MLQPSHWLCPDLRPYWQLAPVPGQDCVILQATQVDRQVHFSLAEGVVLQYFTGEYTIGQIQAHCRSLSPTPDFVPQLVQRLVGLDILAIPGDLQNSPRLKACVQWICHPEGYWILRNPEDVTFLQVSDRDYALISQLGQVPLAEFTHSRTELHHLLQLLSATAMLEGSTLPQPPQCKFTPLHLLSFKFRLCNPDRWLTRHVDRLRWLWTRSVALILTGWLIWSALVAGTRASEILYTGQALWATGDFSLLLGFGLLMMAVVSVHELGHAFTLKHYGGIVPEIGLMFMCLMPGCYTNTTDAYCLTRRRQRVWVVAAGVLCQWVMWAIAFWVWNFSSPATWLHTTSYLLMVAALFTVAINLNPLSKFDGYYLAVALTGINNLRSRSFQFYRQLLHFRLTAEPLSIQWILAIYAPFSLVYSLLIFGHLLFWLLGSVLLSLPMVALLALLLWLLYFVTPTPSKT
jgi:putative peptide zinc metalloprotease protein